jgi:hypothetical protein
VRHHWTPGRNGYVSTVLSRGTAVLTLRCRRDGCLAGKRHVHNERGHHIEYCVDLVSEEWTRKCPPCAGIRKRQ